ncbi:MAG: glycosyltransferase family 2 protein [Candidatus Levyibacteriota bacterium]
MNISVVIPNYNGKHLLEKNLPKVMSACSSYKEGFVEFIVADDASVDGSVEFLEAYKKNKKIHVIVNKKNKGFSGNVNSGVAVAKGDIIILLNTDVIPRRDFLLPLLSHFTDTSVFAVGCMDESIEGKKTVLRGRGIGSWKKGFLIHGPGSLDRENTLWVSGGSGAFRKSIWGSLGGMQELYSPFYWEDIDICYRAQKSGYKIIFEKKSIVLHEHEKGSIKKQFSSDAVSKTAYRNQFQFIWMNITDTDLLINHLFWLPYYVLSALLRKDSAFLSGFFNACCRLGEIRRVRRVNKKLFVMTDKKVLSQFS